MEDSGFKTEDKEQKQFRKRLLETARENCLTISNELHDWKTKRQEENPGFLSCKSKNSAIVDEKIAEIQNKLKQRKSLSRERQITPSSGVSAFDLKASLQTSVLNQEILKKQYQLILEKHELEVRGLKTLIESQNLQISELKCSKTKVLEDSLQSITAELKSTTESMKYFQSKALEKDSALDHLAAQLQDKDRIISLLEQRVSTLETSLTAYKTKEFEYNSCKIFLEKEKKRREIAENEYKILVDEVKSLNERSCNQLKSEHEAEIFQYQQIIKSLEARQAEINLSGASYTSK